MNYIEQDTYEEAMLILRAKTYRFLVKVRDRWEDYLVSSKARRWDARLRRWEYDPLSRQDMQQLRLRIAWVNAEINRRIWADQLINSEIKHRERGDLRHGVTSVEAEVTSETAETFNEVPGQTEVVILDDRKTAFVIDAKIAAFVALRKDGPTRLVFTGGGYLDICGGVETWRRLIRLKELTSEVTPQMTKNDISDKFDIMRSLLVRVRQKFGLGTAKRMYKAYLPYPSDGIDAIEPCDYAAIITACRTKLL